MNCSHFSQMISGGTQKFGFGPCVAKDGTYYICARYAPAGNVAGKWKENVLPPKDGKKDLIQQPAATGFYLSRKIFLTDRLEFSASVKLSSILIQILSYLSSLTNHTYHYIRKDVQVFMEKT